MIRVKGYINEIEGRRAAAAPDPVLDPDEQLSLFS